MPKKKRTDVVRANQIERQIYIIRGQRVMLDSDLAKLYGVPTFRLNEAVRRNRDRFPDDFAYPLTLQEFRDLISQIAISKVGRGGRRKLPWVFTEHGVAMLSSVLRSETAIKVNVEIMRAFVRMRRLLATPGELVAQIAQLTETVQLHDDQIKVIADVLRKMMEKPTTPQRRITGFEPSPEDIDEVERMRQVRREIEGECKTAAGLFEWIERLERERDKRERTRRARHKLATDAATT